MWDRHPVKRTSYSRNRMKGETYKGMDVFALLAFARSIQPTTKATKARLPLLRTLIMALTSSTDTIKAVGVSEYGPLENLEARRLPKPSPPTGRQVLVSVKAAAVNPIDIKVRGGTYDDAPDYYERVKPLTQAEPHFHVMGYDGAGVVLGVGPDVKHFKEGDEIYYLGNPLGQGCYEEEMLIDERQ